MQLYSNFGGFPLNSALFEETFNKRDGVHPNEGSNGLKQTSNGLNYIIHVYVYIFTYAQLYIYIYIYHFNIIYIYTKI